MIILSIFWTKNRCKNSWEKLKKMAEIRYPLFLMDEIQGKHFDLLILFEKNSLLSLIQRESHHLLIGKCFHKKTNQPIQFPEQEQLDPSKLIKDYWGNYLFFDFSDENILKILKDPVGQIPFFYYEAQEMCLMSTEISCIQDFLEKKSFSWHWPYLANFLLYGHPTTSFSPFQEIFELLSGSVLTISQKSIEQSVQWIPQNNFGEIENINLTENLTKTLSRTIWAFFCSCCDGP